MGFKTCPKCGVTLSYTKFGCNKSRKDGMQPYCITCMRKARKKNSVKDKSKELARQRQKKYREKKKLVKVDTKTVDSITNKRNHNNNKKHRITLNPKPIKKNRG